MSAVLHTWDLCLVLLGWWWWWDSAELSLLLRSLPLCPLWGLTRNQGSELSCRWRILVYCSYLFRCSKEWDSVLWSDGLNTRKVTQHIEESGWWLEQLVPSPSSISPPPHILKMLVLNSINFPIFTLLSQLGAGMDLCLCQALWRQGTLNLANI